MIEDALTGKADLIAVYSLDRLFRDHFLTELYRRKLEEKGIGIASIIEDLREGESALPVRQLFGRCPLCCGILEDA